MSKKIIEGRWDCSSCDTKGILGRYRECPNCGKPRGEDVKFYLPDKKDYVPEEQAEKINRNPNWLCEFCGSYNSDDLDRCKSCGAERGSKNYFDVQKEQEEKKEQKYKDEKVKVTEDKSYQKSSESKMSTASKMVEKEKTLGKMKRPFIAVMVALISIIFIFGMVHIFSPKEASMKITGFSWERSIEVEQYKTFHKSDWSVPDGARVTSQRREIHHYDQVLDHYETKTRQVTKSRISHYETRTSTRDLGNGYFEENTYQEPVYETYYDTETYQDPVYRDEPVYRTKYYYDIDRWVYERSITSSGNNQKPYWGKEDLKTKERVSGKNEKYMVNGITNEKNARDRTVKVDFAKWKGMKIGQTIRIKIYVGGITKFIE